MDGLSQSVAYFGEVICSGLMMRAVKRGVIGVALKTVCILHTERGGRAGLHPAVTPL